jgi:hypothetical protein
MMANIGPAIGVAIIAIIVFALSPSLSGVFYALIVVVGACTVYLLRQMYLNELDRDDLVADDEPVHEAGDE